ncbi:MAG: hypothetical protein HY695_06440 [Deltaproteobacteria bacterium]|nr:hypothetical protein [Deltaproteobacteria bacterium]
MNSAEFLILLEQQTDLQLLDRCLHDDSAPYVFEPNPGGWDIFRDELVSGLGVSRSKVVSLLTRMTRGFLTSMTQGLPGRAESYYDVRFWFKL